MPQVKHPQLNKKSQPPETEKKLEPLLIKIFGVVGAALIALLGTIYTTNVIRKTEQEKLIATQNIEINKRFDTAISGIGNQDRDIRSSAIISMKQIMKESPEKQWDIVLRLTRLIRDKSKAPKRLDIILEQREKAPSDVQEAIVVIKERDPNQDNNGKVQQEEKRIINLSKVNLYGTDLQNAHLPKADLSGSDLTNRDLKNSDLTEVLFRWTYLRGASLSEANLTNANLTHADLGGAVLKSTNLTGADLKGANLKGANLTTAKFTDKQIEQTCNWEQAIYAEGKLGILKQKIAKRSKTRSECKKFNQEQKTTLNKELERSNSVRTPHSSKPIQKPTVIIGKIDRLKPKPIQKLTAKIGKSHPFKSKPIRKPTATTGKIDRLKSN
jgi:Pentapeptide repeats (8 copies)